MLRVILVIIRHLKSCIEIFIIKNDNKLCRNETTEFNSILDALNNYSPRTQNDIEAKEWPAK